MAFLKMFTIIIVYLFAYLHYGRFEEYKQTDASIPPETLHFEVDFKYLKKLPRFWTNTGFCPPAPTNDSFKLAEFFLAEKTLQNLEYISALPNTGLKVVRIHWLLNLIQYVGLDKRKGLQYDFSILDRFLDQLMEIRLYPVIEFMGNPSNRLFNQKHFSQAYLWKDLVYQLLTRYIKRYGIRKVKKWKFETWNEPDLTHYNILNYTLPDYEDYVQGVWNGLNEAGVKDNNCKFLLNGPAGLFKDNRTHHLCWGILDKCNSNLSMCPFDILTYHRKGLGEAEDVLNESFQLMNDINLKYPNLSKMKISNSEADPTTDWSKPLYMNSDVRYAVTLLNIVFLHWNAKYNNILQLLQSISHDNGFISYHPFEFYQRTLLAMFQFNNTNPVEIQLIQKPVYGALGMLGNLGAYAGPLKNISEIQAMSMWSKAHPKGPFFVCGIISSENKLMNERLKSKVNINVAVKMSDYKYVDGEKFMSLIEYLGADETDPVYIWNLIGKPSYPNADQREMMRKSQGPHVLNSYVELHRNESLLSFQITAAIKRPWVISIRICSELLPIPSKLKRLRIHKVNENEVILFWKEKFNRSRCTKTYEIYFLPHHGKHNWISITGNKHVPFMSYHFAPDTKVNLTIRGQYKVRAVDVFERKGKFSLIKKF